jgi:hypothetical protein
MREPIMAAISSVTRLANDRYRRSAGPIERRLFRLNAQRGIEARRGGMPVSKIAIESLLAVANAGERIVIRRVAARLTKRQK